MYEVTSCMGFPAVWLQEEVSQEVELGRLQALKARLKLRPTDETMSMSIWRSNASEVIDFHLGAVGPQALLPRAEPRWSAETAAGRLMISKGSHALRHGRRRLGHPIRLKSPCFQAYSRRNAEQFHTPTCSHEP